MASASGTAAPSSLYIHSIPASVMEDFCRKMDCLNDYDWMRFASYIINDQTELRKIKLMEKAGISITRELMWWWEVRLATVKQLLELLQGLQLFWAAQIIEDWKSASFATEPVEYPEQEDASLQGGKNSEATTNERKTPGAPNSDPVLKANTDMLPIFPPPCSIDLPHSLQSNPPASTCVKPCSAALPQQETVPDLLSVSLLWTPQEVEVATSGFKEENQINEGIFATIYKGWRGNTLYVIKRLKEQNETQKLFRTEVQICFRCCHPNILRLLGFSVDGGSHCLIYPYMPNGSLMDRLQCQGGSAALTWEQRIRIALGLIQAIQHLHHFGILHGNVKSSNVLMDENFAPQLGHSGLRLHPAEKKTEHAVMKTKVMQASLAYFPEDFVRHGQLTEKVDIFGCGIVLTEILTGMKAVDEGRKPIFLKDIILDEIEIAKQQFSPKDKSFERHAATEICRKYQDRNVVHLPPASAIYMATAACVCLRKKNANLAEVCEILEMASYQNPYLRGTERRKYTGLPVNIPEETNDEPPSPFNLGVSDGCSEGREQYRMSNNADFLPPLIGVLPLETHTQHILRVPCETDESSTFSWGSVTNGACQPPNNWKLDIESASSVKCRTNYPENDSSFPTKTMDSEEMTSFSNGGYLSHTEREDCAATCLSQALIKEIKINDKKKEMMEQFFLYEENKLSSSELFNF